jgi:hypothetical protein
MDPFVQRVQTGRLHDLETAGAGGVHPTRLIHDTLGQHSSATSKPFPNRLRVAAFETFDDHKEHDWQCTRSGATTVLPRVASSPLTQPFSKCYKQLPRAGGVQPVMQADYRRHKQSDAAKSALLNSVLRWKRVRNSGSRSRSDEFSRARHGRD